MPPKPGIGDDPPPKRIIKRSTKPPVWVELSEYPGLAERVRGARLFRTTDEFPLTWRITNAPFRNPRKIAWPAVVAIKNERHIRFYSDARLEFGLILPGEAKVSEWRPAADMPEFTNKHVVLSNPDYVLMNLDWSI